MWGGRDLLATVTGELSKRPIIGGETHLFVEKPLSVRAANVYLSHPDAFLAELRCHSNRAWVLLPDNDRRWYRISKLTLVNAIASLFPSHSIPVAWEKFWEGQMLSRIAAICAAVGFVFGSSVAFAQGAPGAGQEKAMHHHHHVHHHKAMAAGHASIKSHPHHGKAHMTRHAKKAHPQ
jgi:hypothetical protein